MSYAGSIDALRGPVRFIGDPKTGTLNGYL